MSNSAARIARYLDARSKAKGLDPDCITGMDVDCMLTVSDLRDVLAALAAPAPLVFHETQSVRDNAACVQPVSRNAAAPTTTLPERDQSKPAEQQGLFRKFDVRRTDGSDQPGGKHHGCDYFVIDVTHDQHAAAALTAYADAVAATHPMLAADMRARYARAALAAATPAPARKFKRGERVRKKSGSQWLGHVVGEYSTNLTPEGYAVESEAHAGSVQIYPASALEKA